MNNDNFEIRTYGKSELAMLYFPNAETKKGALNNLNFYINKKKGLRRKLLKLGSPPKAHNYLPIEVEIIVNALGEPYGKTYRIKFLVIPRMARDRPPICHSAIFRL